MSNKEEIKENIDEVVEEIFEEDMEDIEEFQPLFEASQHVIMNMIRDLSAARQFFMECKPYEAIEILESLKQDHEFLFKTSEMMIELIDSDVAVNDDDEGDDEDEENDDKIVVAEDINPEKELDS